MTEPTHTPLPCPFCGGAKIQQNTKAKGYFIKKAAQRAGKDASNHLVRCTKCGAKGPLKHSEAEALTAWNTRAVSHHRLIEALEDILDAVGALTNVSEFPNCLNLPEERGREILDLLAALKESRHG
ncbi:Lar family restriction alleviation protein [Staphylococcus aureus]|uniref:Lar family restriction alleviation protein n=1 Tax=Staphylococcus aureus TaxID=1280 RepID=UPI00237BA908|nr:Lar family restriction alleviation protein [Staphylococcus aureus]MDD9396373.1 Lar family restriction alleviation protein [Staphylococcus aureus]